MEKSDEEITAIAERELRDILGIDREGEAAVLRASTAGRCGMPQYTMGHLDRVDSIEERVQAIPGLALAGGAYRGVGLPNCIESGEAGVRKVLGEWGIDLAEDHVEEKRAY